MRTPTWWCPVPWPWIPQGPPARILDAMIDGSLVYLMSGSLFAEYAAVLHRPAIALRHGLTAREVDLLLTVLAASAMWRKPAHAGSAPDPGDDHLWALLASWPESRLVTGDQRLFDSPPRPGVVLTPREAVLELDRKARG